MAPAMNQPVVCSPPAAPAAPAALAAPAAPSQAAPAAPQPSQSPSHAAFLHSWKTSVGPKLHQLLQMLQAEPVAQSIAVCQIWTYLPVLTEGRQLLKPELLCLLGDPELQAFHAGCRAEGVTPSSLGPMGKVWENGAVQVVQHVDGLPADAHPRNRLGGELPRRIAECIYVPVYDPSGRVSQGVLAVVELLVRSTAHDPMVVANAISCLTAVMEALQLSISSPQAAAQRSSAALQRAGGGGAAGSAGSSSSSVAVPRRGAGASWGSGGSSGGGGALGRTASMHKLAA